MQGRIRRVVTGHDENGKAVVLEDGLAPAVRTNPLRPGHISVDLWKTAASPVIVRRSEPDPTAGPKQIHPPPRGTVFRISEIAPETEAIRNMPPEQSRAVFAAMGNESASTAGRRSDVIPSCTAPKPWTMRSCCRAKSPCCSTTRTCCSGPATW